MMPVCSPGSNHVGASVMCTAHVICDCAAARSGVSATSSTTTRMTARTDRRAFMKWSSHAEMTSGSGENDTTIGADYIYSRAATHDLAATIDLTGDPMDSVDAEVLSIKPPTDVSRRAFLATSGL